MSPLEVPALAYPAFGLSARSSGSKITLTFNGNADMMVIDDLYRYLASIHEHACKDHASEVVVDFQDLEFMNSSCFKCFVTWISTVKSLGLEERYQIRFICKRGMHWQKGSLEALCSFAVDVVSIQT